MIQIIPSISVIKGEMVNLRQGNYNRRKVYRKNLLDIVRSFEDCHIQAIHLTDLESIRTGKISNQDTLQLFKTHTNLDVSFGGHIKDERDLVALFNLGADKIMLNKTAVTDKEKVASWVKTYGPDKIVITANFFNEKVCIENENMEKKMGGDLFAHIEYYYKMGVKRMKCADLSRDGLMQGPSFNTYTLILQTFPDLQLLASGGIGSIEDIKKLEALGVYGVVLGKALHEEKLPLSELKQFTEANSPEEESSPEV